LIEELANLTRKALINTKGKEDSLIAALKKI
jgi:hypothetical protein